MARGLGSIVREAGSRLPAAFVRPFARPSAVFFHGVERRIDDSRVQSNHHDFTAFSSIARGLRDNFDVLPLALLDEVLSAPKRFRRAVFLMADDGYRNNLGEAAEILSALGLPWTLFVSTHHIDSGARSPVFAARLFFLFAPSGNYDIAHLGLVSLADSRGREAQADVWIGRLLCLDAARAGEAVAAMEAGLGAEFPDLLERFRSDAFLTWQEVAALKAKGVEIGAHASEHWPMHGAQPALYLRTQAVQARARVEAEIGPCRYFAYPFGNTEDVCRAAWQAVRDAGYDYAFTTLSGSLDASANRWLMPRYGLRLHETRLASLVPFLRAGNGRLRNWQCRLS